MWHQLHELSMEEMRVVARYAVASAQEVLPLFEEVNSEDLRPRLAIRAAWDFVHGAARTTLQRVTAPGMLRTLGCHGDFGQRT